MAKQSYSILPFSRPQVDALGGDTHHPDGGDQFHLPDISLSPSRPSMPADAPTATAGRASVSGRPPVHGAHGRCHAGAGRKDRGRFSWNGETSTQRGLLLDSLPHAHGGVLAPRASAPGGPDALGSAHSEGGLDYRATAGRDTRRSSTTGSVANSVTSINLRLPIPRRPKVEKPPLVTTLLTTAAGVHPRRLSEFGEQLMRQQEQAERERENDGERERLSLPHLVLATRRSLPGWRSERVKEGKVVFMQRGEEDSSSERTAEKWGQAAHGAGAVPDSARSSWAACSSSKKLLVGAPTASSKDKDVLTPREEDVLWIASSMGLVKHPPNQDHKQVLKGTSINKARASAQVDVSQVSAMGVRLSVLTRFADSIQTELSTEDMVQQYIHPATEKMGCRYIDLVNEKQVEAPAYYVIHSWKMGFRALVDTLRAHFAIARASEDDVVIWVDFFCVNQHKALEASELASVGEVLRHASKALFVIDRHGVCFTRTWVLYELWLAAQNDNRQVIGQAGVAGEKLVVLPSSWAWDDMYHAYITLDIPRSSSANERQRLLLLGEMQKADLAKVATDIKNVLLAGAKYDLSRSSKLAMVNPRRYFEAATTYSMLLYHHTRYIEAEDAMRGIKNIIERLGHGQVLPQDEAGYMLHLAMIHREKGVLIDAQRLLIDFGSQFKDMHVPMFQGGTTVLVDLHCGLKSYTKAEMLCRKNLEQVEKQYGRMSLPMVHGLLQMANISAAQRLSDEAADHALEAMKVAQFLEGPEGIDAAACYHILAQCYYFSHRKDDAGPLLERALVIRLARLGTDHPLTLESKSLQAMILVQQGRLREAEVLMGAILRSRMRSYGPEHHDTLETMGSIADLLRQMKKVDEAQYQEKRMLEVGRSLLQHTRMNKFRSLQFICKYLQTREHLLDKAAMFLAKAYIVYKERLGSEADLTLETKQQLLDIITNANRLGLQALHNADLFQRTEQYAVAEEMLRQAWALSKLVKPEEDHAEMAQGLADALFAQDKPDEAKSVMRAAGLVKGVETKLPSSYLRWLNKRVAKYLEKRAALNPGSGDEGLGDDD